MTTNPFLRAHEELDRSVEAALIGHRAGERTADEYLRALDSKPEDWPENWFEATSKSYERFVEPAPITVEPLAPGRRTTRAFSASVLPRHLLLDVLSVLIVPDARSGRSAPSAGGLYPVETYILGLRTDLPPCSYHLNMFSGSLTQLFDLPDEATTSAFPAWAGTTAEVLPHLVVVFSSAIYKPMRKYGPRAYRYALLEAGAMAMTVSLRAQQLGLGSVWLGGFDDGRMAEVIGIQPAIDLEIPLLLLGVGLPEDDEPVG